MEWLAHEMPPTNALLQIAKSLGCFWNLRGNLVDGKGWLECAIKLDDGRDPTARTRALLWLSMLLGTHGEFERATVTMEDSIEVARANEDVLGIACALICKAFGLLHGANAIDPAVELANESRMLFETVDVLWGVRMSQALIAEAAERIGDWDRAKVLYEQLLQENDQVEGSEFGTAMCRYGLASILESEGDRVRARSLFVDALREFDDLGDFGKIAWCLEAVGRTTETNQSEGAAKLFGAADALRILVAVPLPEAERPNYDEAIQSLRLTMGEEQFELAWQAGHTLPKDVAISEADLLVSGTVPYTRALTCIAPG